MGIIFAGGLLAMAMLTGGRAGAAAEPADSAVGRYREPVLAPRGFNFEDLGMIEAERREYAQRFAEFALAEAGKNADAEGRLQGVPQARYDLARKLVGLALHLDPRSRPAVVANGRLKAGVIPKKSSPPAVAAGTLASLLVGRAAELRKAGGAGNLKLAGCFLDLATGLDPSNDDAIYAFETFKMDGRQIDWKGILGGE